MPTDVVMPRLGVAQDTGTVLRWLRNEGETVVKGEPVVEIETDKVTVALEAPASGVLVRIAAASGEEVAVGTAIAVVAAPGETLPAPPPPRGRPPASPKARRLAAERGLALDGVRGSGPGGAVLAADLAAAEGGQGAAAATWRTMVRRLAGAWPETPHFYLVREVDCSRPAAWLRHGRATPGLEGLTYTDLFVVAVASALAEHPRVNATWADDAVTLHREIDVGVAVATDDALVVPVIRRADRLELREVVARRHELVARARAHALAPEDVAGGTFTISNLGPLGVDAFTAVVNPPQAGILAVGRIADRVVAVDGVPAVQPTAILTLSLDHRVVDGAAGARFLESLARALGGAAISDPGSDRNLDTPGASR